MNYEIKELDEFSVIGQEVELTNSKSRNVQTSVQFWRTFNSNLKKSYLSQQGNWVKYAFMERKDGKMLYYCAIPKRVVIPEGFIYKNIKPCTYIVVEHIGSMNDIYETYTKLYKEVLPKVGCNLAQEDFLHFERYDDRFHWNREDSVIEIWLPISFSPESK